jgi:hypothetical protein
LAPRSFSNRLAAVCRSGWAEMTGIRARWQASLMRELNAWLLKALRKRDRSQSAKTVNGVLVSAEPDPVSAWRQCLESTDDWSR